MNPARQSLTTSLNSDVTHYAVLCIGESHEIVPGITDRISYFADRRLEDSCSRATTIADIINGEWIVAKVFAFNPVEHVCDDVTAEIAEECAHSLDPTEPVSEQLYDFIAHNAGFAFVHGLRIRDNTFAAA